MTEEERSRGHVWLTNAIEASHGAEDGSGTSIHYIEHCSPRIPVRITYLTHQGWLEFGRQRTLYCTAAWLLSPLPGWPVLLLCGAASVGALVVRLLFSRWVWVH